jgi:thioredoxin-dependent peroxiredoxin
MPYRINKGDKIPSFSCKNQRGILISDKDLQGTPVVLYFYPKDETPGCTKEACSFRDHMDRLNQLNALVIGISPDSPDSHRLFIDKHQLKFPLLCDEKKEMCKKFDVLRDQSLERTTFVIDPDGIIDWIERPVSIEGHVERVLEAVRACAD